MTIRGRGIWVSSLIVLIVGTGLWLAMFLTLYYPVREMVNTIVVLDTNYWSLNLQ